MIIDARSTHVRLLLRFYFTAVFHLLAFVGKKCFKLTVESRLLATKTVKCVDMLGWRSAGEQVSSAVRLRTWPGGGLGLLMVIVGALSIASDLAVSGLVRTIDTPARCPFGIGLVVAKTPFNYFQTTPPNGAAYSLAAQAQRSSQNNGGQRGIYWKANMDTNFYADEVDVIGSWACQDEENDQLYESFTTPNDIVGDLLNQSLLFSSWAYEVSYYQDGTFSHLTAWSTSSNSSIGEPFNVRASIDLTANGNDTKIMRSFLCKLQAPEIEWVLSQINSFRTMQQWVSGLQGHMYNGSGTPASDDVGGVLQWYLNSLVMVAGGNNYLLATPTGDKTQGCLAFRTFVPATVVALFVTITVIAIFLILYWVVAWKVFQYRDQQSVQKGTKYSDSVKEYTPTAILSWMAQAARENVMKNGGDVVRIEERDIVGWEFGPKENGVNVGLVKLVNNQDDRSKRVACKSSNIKMQL